MWKAELEGQIEKSGELKTTGNGHFSTGEYDLAANCYEQALSLLPTHDVCKELADERKRKGKENAFDSGTDEPAAHARAVLHGNLAATQKHLEQREDAIKNATEALRLEPTYVKVRIRRAELYELEDKPHEALEDWKIVIEADPKHINANKALKRLPPTRLQTHFFEIFTIFFYIFFSRNIRVFNREWAIDWDQERKVESGNDGRAQKAGKRVPKTVWPFDGQLQNGAEWKWLLQHPIPTIVYCNDSSSYES